MRHDYAKEIVKEKANRSGMGGRVLLELEYSLSYSPMQPGGWTDEAINLLTMFLMSKI